MKYRRNEKLRECPFCGSTNVMIGSNENEFNADTLRFLIRCKNCYAMVKLEANTKNKQKLISSWNRRVKQEFIQEKLF